MPIEIEFVKDSKVNKSSIKKGTRLTFTKDVAQKYIDAGDAIMYKKSKAKEK